MKRHCALLLVVTLALSAVMLMAADEAPIVVDNFSLGLNTTQKPTKLQPGEAVIAHELDLTKNPGGLTVRDGYDLALTAYGNDSILTNGLFVYNKLGGKRQLMMVADQAEYPYATLYATDENGIILNLGSLEAPDTFYCVPDVDWNDSVAAARSQSIYEAGLVSWRSPSGYAWSGFFDTGTTASEIVDSIVANLDGGFGVSVTDNGDTAVFAEGSADDQISVVPFPPLYLADSGWVGRWSILQSDSNANIVASRLPSSGGVNWVEHNGLLYVLNSVAPGIVYDGTSAQRFPVKTAGTLNPMPVRVDSTGIGAGRYRYAVKFTGYGSGGISSPESTITHVLGSLSDEIEVCDTCDVLITSFPQRANDAWKSGTQQTMEIWRTTAIENILSQGDTIWYTGLSALLSLESDYNTLEVLDTITDSALRAGGSYVVLGASDIVSARFDTTSDSAVAGGTDRDMYKEIAPGAPVIAAFRGSTHGLGVWEDADTVAWAEAAGWSWFIVRLDTLMGIYSDSGRTVNIYQSQEANSYNSKWSFGVSLSFDRANAEEFDIILPPAEGSGITYLLYRAPIVPNAYDTVWGGARQYNSQGIPLSDYENRLRADSFVSLDYRLIGEFTPGDTVTDSLHYDDLLARTPYQRNRAPSRVKAAQSYNGVLYLADERNLYASTVYDTVVLYNALNQRPIGNASSGQITSMWPERGYLKVSTTNRLFNVYNLDSDVFGVVELATHYGNVSAHSAVQAPEGTYILSDDEVRLISEGVFRDRSIADPNVAGQLDNFSKLTAAAKAKAFGTYFDNKYLLTIGDTTYVANKVRGRDGYQLGWTTWSFPISAAALYRAGDDLSDVADTLYFSKPGGIQVYRLGGAVTDAETDATTIPIDWQWRSGAFPGMTWTRWQPSELLFSVYSTDTTSANLVIDLYNANDSIMLAAQQSLGRIDTANIYRFELGTIPESPYWYIDLYTTNPIGKAPPPNAETTVEGLQIRMIRRGDI